MVVAREERHAFFANGREVLERGARADFGELVDEERTVHAVARE
jgi:hypothetical protein